nr:hypothetical protein CFP56_20563 [Quercus suber]
MYTRGVIEQPDDAGLHDGRLRQKEEISRIWSSPQSADHQQRVDFRGRCGAETRYVGGRSLESEDGVEGTGDRRRLT